MATQLRFLKITAWFLFYLCFILSSLWGTLALYYNKFAIHEIGLVLSAIFGMFSISLLCINRHKKKRWSIVWLILFASILVYWQTIQPTHDHIWRADMQKMPYAIINGDDIEIHNYRDFEYRSLTDFTPHYESRKIQLSHIVSIDFYLSYWMTGPVAHTFVSFNFENAEPVTISIEARYEDGEDFDPLASLFKEFELIYIVGSERDIVRVRTNYREEDVYRYSLNVSKEHVQQLFLVYMQRINELANKPEFYHLLSNNCTINIARYANRVGRKGGFDIRLLLNGYSDRYLYDNGYIDTNESFDVIRQQANITQKARSIKDPSDFYEAIRSPK